MSGNDLGLLRKDAGLPGHLVCIESGVGRSRLSDIERGYVHASPAEVQRIQAAIKRLAQAKSKVARVATRVGWPLSAI